MIKTFKKQKLESTQLQDLVVLHFQLRQLLVKYSWSTCEALALVRFSCLQTVGVKRKSIYFYCTVHTTLLLM